GLLVAKLTDLAHGVQSDTGDGHQRDDQAGDETDGGRQGHESLGRAARGWVRLGGVVRRWVTLLEVGGAIHAPRAASMTRAPANTSASFHGAATTCTPIGRPSADCDTGTDMAGFCSRFNHAV